MIARSTTGIRSPIKNPLGWPTKRGSLVTGGLLVTAKHRISWALLFCLAAASCASQDLEDTALPAPASVETEAVQEEPDRPVDYTGLIEAWIADAATASAHGPSTLVRFATLSRDPAVGGDRECVPPFADLLVDDPTALADGTVEAVSADAYRLVAGDATIDLVVRNDRVFHQQGCSGSSELLARAEAEAEALSSEEALDETAPAGSEPAAQPAPQRQTAPAPEPAPSAPATRTPETATPTPDPGPAAPVSHHLLGTVVQTLVPASSTCDHPDPNGRIGTIPPAQVVAKDAAGAIVAIEHPTVPGVLRPVGPSFVCEYQFRMELPDSPAYTFELDNEDPLVVSRSELASMDWKLNLLQFEH